MLGFLLSHYSRELLQLIIEKNIYNEPKKREFQIKN